MQILHGILFQGVLCFDYCHNVDLLVTGSMDHLVRVWNPYVPSKPVAQLFKHSTAVLSVIIASDTGLIFSFSQDSVCLSIYMHVPALYVAWLNL